MVRLAQNTRMLAEQCVSHWESAEFMINLARERQRQTGTKFVGSIHLDLKLRKDIGKFLKSDPISLAICDSAQMKNAAERLILRFEELCRRREVPINSRLNKTYAYRHLLLDLHLNFETTGAPPRKLVTATLLNSELMGSLFRDRSLGKMLETCPSMIVMLAERNPSDIRSALTEVEKKVQAIIKDPQFDLLRSWPAVVRRIVLSRTTTYREYLGELQDQAKLLLDKHRDQLTGRESIVIDALTQYGSARAEKEIIRMLERPKFKR